MRSGLVRLLPLAVLLVCACAHRPVGPDGQPIWVQVESEHFVLRAATDEPTARARADQLERVREALLAGSWHAETDAPGKVQVVLVEDDLALRDLFSKGTGGVTTVNGLGQVFVVASAQQDLGDFAIFKHELSHVIAHQFLLRSPLWLSEGLATYLETFQLGGDSATFGKAHLGAARASSFGALDLRQLMSAGPETYLGSYSDRESFYARAWLLVHLLANRHRDELNAYIGRLARAEEPAAAWQACCAALTPERLEEEAAEYQRGGTYYTLTIPLPKQEHAMTARTLRPAEVRATEAQLGWAGSLMGLPALRQKAEGQARQALSLDPAEPLAALALCDLTGDSAGCVQAARASAKAHPEDPRPFLLLTRALRVERGADWEQAIERAAQLAPEDPAVLVSLAELRLSQRRMPEALEAALHANRSAPGRPAGLDAIATVLAMQGQCEQAVAFEKRVLEVLPDGAGPEVASETRARIVELGRVCAQNKAALAPPQRIVSTPPRKLQCAQAAPKLPRLRVKKEVVVSVHYKIGEDGVPQGLTFNEDAPKALVRALTDHLSSCRYEPAMLEGKPIAIEVDEHFTYGPR